MSAVFCTSMSSRLFDEYGHIFLETWNRHNAALPLWVFTENGSLPIAGPHYVDLRNDRDLAAFKTRWHHYSHAHGIIGVTSDGQAIADYRLQALRFAPKVFSVTHEHRPMSKWWVWIDADVTFLKPFDDDFRDRVMPKSKLVSYLARKGMWEHSECGFVAYRHDHPAVAQLLAKLRRLYVTGDIFLMKETHDSHVFDRLVKAVWPHPETLLDLSEGVDPTHGEHPWPHTVLGAYMSHEKGARKYAETG